MMIEMDSSYVKATQLSLKLHINLKGPNDLLLKYLKSPSQQHHLERPLHILKQNRSYTTLSSKLSPSTYKTQRPSSTSTRPLPKKQQRPEEHNQIVVPNQCIKCDPEIVIILINRMLTSLIKINDTTTTNTPPTRFHSKTPPAIQIFSYLNRLRKFNSLNSNILLTTIYYIDVLSYNYTCFSLNSWTVHRFLLVATMIAQKALEDFFYTNDHYAKVGGVSLQELNCLELDFLQRIDWRTIPIHNPNVQQLYYHKLVEMTGKSSSSNDDTEFKFTKFVMNTDDANSYEEDERTKDEEEKDADDADVDEDECFYDSDEDEEDDEEDEEDEDDEVDEEDEDDVDVDEEDVYWKENKLTNGQKDDDMEDADNVVGELPDIPMYKYDSHGLSIDGTSSPHLKRRYSSD